jgi:hypothetical protein
MMVQTNIISFAAALMVLAGGNVALAQSRPDTMRMSCAASSELVQRSGTIVMNSGPNVFDRYVSSQAFCAKEETTVPVWVPAADTRQCFVGWVCQRQSWGAGPP